MEKIGAIFYLILFFGYIVVSWNVLSSLQKRWNIFYFGSLGNYFASKIVLCLMLGWLFILIRILVFIFDSFTSK